MDYILQIVNIIAATICVLGVFSIMPIEPLKTLINNCKAARLINAYYYNTKDINDGLRHWIERCCDIEDGAGLYIGFFDYIRDGLICDIPCKLRLGYTNKYLFAKIVRIEIIYGEDTDLAIDNPVYAIYLKDIKECK